METLPLVTPGSTASGAITPASIKLPRVFLGRPRSKRRFRLIREPDSIVPEGFLPRVRFVDFLAPASGGIGKPLESLAKGGEGKGGPKTPQNSNGCGGTEGCTAAKAVAACHKMTSPAKKGKTGDDHGLTKLLHAEQEEILSGVESHINPWCKIVNFV